MGSFLRTAAFAELCGTTKATLLHYDHVGLLKPGIVRENGYRGYKFEQFFAYNFINTLKKAGCSLREIAELLRSRGSEDFLSIIEEKLRLLEKERKELAQREASLKILIDSAREALNLRCDVLLFEDHPEERLEVVPVSTVDASSEAKVSAMSFSHLLKTAGNDRTISPRPYGSIVDIALLREGAFKELYYLCGASGDTPLVRLHIKAAGKYAVMAHIGNEESHARCLRRMIDQLDLKGSCILSECYWYDMFTTELYDITGAVMAGKFMIRVR